MSTTVLIVEDLTRSETFYAALLSADLFEQSDTFVRGTSGNVHYCDSVDPEGNIIQLAERLRR